MLLKIIWLCFILIAGQMKNADRRTWNLVTSEKRKITFCLLKNQDLIAYFKSGLHKSVFYYQAFLLKILPLFMVHLNL